MLKVAEVLNYDQWATGATPSNSNRLSLSSDAASFSFDTIASVALGLFKD
jgi:hypothetical protein